MTTFTVSSAPSVAAEKIKNYVLSAGMSIECVGSHYSRSAEGKETVMLVFEKYYMRNSSRASLTVVAENLKGKTTVCAVGSGGGQGLLFRFDWGAAGNFEGLVEEALKKNS